MAVTTTTFLADLKHIYGAVQDQVSSEPAFMNLLGDGSKIGKQTNIGGRGFTFLARLRPNFYMGFRPESATAGVGAAGSQGLANAVVSLKYGYVPATITGQAENLSKGDAKAFMQAKALEIKYDTKDMVSHMNVLAVGADQGGALALVAAAPAPAAGSFYADNASGAPSAIYLRVGMPIDTHAVGGGALTCDSSVITAINYATRLVTHTLGTAVAAEAVVLGGEAAITTGTWPYTMDGLTSLVNSTGAMHGLNPSTAAQISWQSFVDDVAGDDLSSQQLHALRTFVKNRGGVNPDLFVFPSAQINQLVKFATQNYQFETSRGGVGKKALDLGYDVFTYAGLPIVEDKDARPDRIYCGATEMMKKFEAIPLSLAEDEAGTWTRLIHTTGIADAVAALMRTYINLGILQRSAWGCIKSLSVADEFVDQPPTI